MVDITEYIVHGGAQPNSPERTERSTAALIAQSNELIKKARESLNKYSQKPPLPVSRYVPSATSRPIVSATSPPIVSATSRPVVSATSPRPVVSKPPVAVGGTHIAYINDPVIYMDRPSMGSRILKSIAIATAIVLIILILYHVFASEPLVSKLEQSGWVVYYLRGCKYCTKQRQVFDDHYDNYVEINSHGRQVEGIDPPIPCNSALLTGFPLWYNVYSREIKLGVQDKESLNMMVL
jgi:hypothetical protein